MRQQCRWAFVAFFIVGAPVFAAELGSEGALLSVEVHGFVSQGFIYTTGNNYLANSKDGNFEFAEVGINFTKALTDRLRVGLQLFTRDLGPLGNYTIRADWFYLDYRWRDWLGFRAGRVKLPFGLYNEFNDIDYARVPVLLPQSVYPTQNRDFLLADTGVEIYGYVRLGPAGALDYRLYGGTIFLATNESLSSPFQLLTLNIPYVAGGRLLWETPLEGLRVGGSVQWLRLDSDLLIRATSTPVSVKLPATLAVGSVEYSVQRLLVAAEYSRWHLSYQSSVPGVFPETAVVSERAYVMAAYQLTSWFHPGLYYSVLFPNVERRTGRADVNQDLALTLRFDINPYWLVKVEGHFMQGTAGLSSGLNSGKPLSELAPDWGAFFVKTTGYF